jgi:transposase
MVGNNDLAGAKALAGKLKKLSRQRIVLEATGGHEYELALRLEKVRLPVAVVNPRQVRDFARTVGRLAKIHPIDAKILAHFAEAVKPPCRPMKGQQLNDRARTGNPRDWSHSKPHPCAACRRARCQRSTVVSLF